MLATTQNGATGVNPGSAYNPGFEKVALDQNAVQALETAYMRGMITSEDIRKREGRIARENAENAAATATAKEERLLAPLTGEAKKLELQSRIKLSPIVTENTAKGIEAELKLRPGALNNAIQQQKIDADLAPFAAELKKATAQAGTAKAQEEIKDPYGLTRQYVSIFGQTPPTKADGSFDLNAAQQRLGAHFESTNLTPVQKAGLQAAASAERVHEIYRDGKMLPDAEIAPLMGKWQRDGKELEIRDNTRMLVRQHLTQGFEKVGGVVPITKEGDIDLEAAPRALAALAEEQAVRGVRMRAAAALAPDKRAEIENGIAVAKQFQKQLKEAQDIIGATGDAVAVGPAQGAALGKFMAWVATYVPKAWGGSDKMYNDQTKLVMLTAKAVLEMATKMKGNLSDRDIKFLERAVPSLSATEDVWRTWLDEISDIAERAITSASQALQAGETPSAGAGSRAATPEAPPTPATASVGQEVTVPRTNIKARVFSPGDPEILNFRPGTWYYLAGDKTPHLR